ncbi:unnamed protein product [Citrullus colocynthis]|uniref:Uncharacterized protein n=1 Tax=Citrullus colocynthis TaxID=252529 RepID=A0ABP0Z147_9ROSI
MKETCLLVNSNSTDVPMAKWDFGDSLLSSLLLHPWALMSGLVHAIGSNWSLPSSWSLTVWNYDGGLDRPSLLNATTLQIRLD